MKSPVIMTEWIVFIALLGLLTSGVVSTVTSKDDAPDETSTETIEQESLPVANVFTGPCQSGTRGDDTIEAHLEANCFKLGEGDDIVLLGEAKEAVLIDTGQGSATGGRIETGAGNDTVISQQNGSINTGAGDDLIFLTLPEDTVEPSYSIDPGPGRDSIDVVQMTSSKTPNLIQSGSGTLEVSLLCDAGSIEFLMLNGSQSKLNGNCAILAHAKAGKEMTGLQIFSQSGFDGDFSGLSHLNFSASIENDRGGPVDQPVRMITGQLQYTDIHVAAKSSKSIDIDIDGSDLTASSHIYLDLSAPEGHVLLKNIGQPDSLLHLDFAENGVLEIQIPDAMATGALSLPEMSGQISHLILRGCFDHALLLDGAEKTTKWTGCEDPIDMSFTSPSRRRNIAIVKDGITARLALGTGSLDVKRLTILPPGQDLPSKAALIIETSDPPDDPDLPGDETAPSDEGDAEMVTAEQASTDEG